MADHRPLARRIYPADKFDVNFTYALPGHLDGLLLRTALTHAGRLEHTPDPRPRPRPGRGPHRTLADDLAHVVTYGEIGASVLARTLVNAAEYDAILTANVGRIALAAVRAAEDDLDRARHDFTATDLRGIDLSSITGLRRDRPGLYEIRGGTTHMPTHTA